MLLYEGERIWKSAMEYNPRGLIYGTPYYIITQDRGIKGREGPYRLQAYDIELEKYVTVEEANDFGALVEKGESLNSSKLDEWRREFYGAEYESMFGENSLRGRHRQKSF